MSRIVITENGFATTIPLDRATPGEWAGTDRGDFMRSVFSLATTYGYSVDMEGQHWPTIPATPEVYLTASNKLGRW
jgi:hypothetical protein